MGDSQFISAKMFLRVIFPWVHLCVIQYRFRGQDDMMMFRHHSNSANEGFVHTMGV